jgi:EAL domain-containing protein (putative c-di-GMP-specific phosphodiesterase class I)
MQLDHPNFVAQIAAAVGPCQGDALEIEITESVIMDDVDRKIAMLDELRNIRVSVAVDDFGTGYSSLSYIAKLPITSLKIDRAFVTGMADHPHGLVMVSSIIALAHALGLKVVAEGVETREQASQLLSLKCDEAQGYLFSPAVPATDFACLLAKS